MGVEELVCRLAALVGSEVAGSAEQGGETMGTARTTQQTESLPLHDQFCLACAGLPARPVLLQPLRQPGLPEPPANHSFVD